MTSNCPKCNGHLAYEGMVDFYVRISFLKCVNCGKLIYQKASSIQTSVSIFPPQENLFKSDPTRLQGKKEKPSR